MSPEEKARLVIDKKLIQSGLIIQDASQLNLVAGLGVAVREQVVPKTGNLRYIIKYHCGKETKLFC